jgi:hypothetical protein
MKLFFFSHITAPVSNQTNSGKWTQQMCPGAAEQASGVMTRSEAGLFSSKNHDLYIFNRPASTSWMDAISNHAGCVTIASTQHTLHFSTPLSVILYTLF